MIVHGIFHTVLSRPYALGYLRNMFRLHLSLFQLLYDVYLSFCLSIVSRSRLFSSSILARRASLVGISIVIMFADDIPIIVVICH